MAETNLWFHKPIYQYYGCAFLEYGSRLHLLKIRLCRIFAPSWNMVVSHIPMSRQDLGRDMVASKFLWRGPIYGCANLPIDIMVAHFWNMVVVCMVATLLWLRHLKIWLRHVFSRLWNMVASCIPMLMQDLGRDMVAPEFLWWGPIYGCTNLPIDQPTKKCMVPPLSNQPMFQ